LGGHFCLFDQKGLKSDVEVFLKAVQKPFDLIRQLLSGEARTQWDKIVKEMFDRDTWMGVNGKTHDGPHLQTWKSLTDCIELHK
jgi:hypothetical protein